jgi:methyl-accepting chemotaxis protein
MQEVANSAQVLQTMGARLKELVEQFKISDE